MDLERWAIVVIGAVFGAVGWLFVGIYLNRRENDRKARSAARAVFFELELNTMNVDVALQHGRFAPLSRATFDRLLPDVANWLPPADLRSLVAAYYSQAGYQQAADDAAIPPPVKAALLQAVSTAHHRALDLVERTAFGVGGSGREHRPGPTTVPATPAGDRVRGGVDG